MYLIYASISRNIGAGDNPIELSTTFDYHIQTFINVYHNKQLIKLISKIHMKFLPQKVTSGNTNYVSKKDYKYMVIVSNQHLVQ